MLNHCKNKGEVVIHGWKTFTGVSVLDKMRALMPYCGHFLVTMVESEGKMQGFSRELVGQTVSLLDGKSLLTIAGGVTTQDDVRFEEKGEGGETYFL